MDFLKILSKLGILRFGVKKGTYRTGTERPSEFQMDDIFNAESDLTTKEDFKKLKEAAKGEKKTS